MHFRKMHLECPAEVRTPGSALALFVIVALLFVARASGCFPGGGSSLVQFGNILGCLIGCSSRYMLSPPYMLLQIIDHYRLGDT